MLYGLQYSSHSWCSVEAAETHAASKQLAAAYKTRCTLAFVLWADSLMWVLCILWSPVVYVLVTEEAAFNFAVVCCTQVQQSLTNVRLHGRWRLPAVRHGTDLCIELLLVRCCSSDVTVMILAVCMCHFLYFAVNTCINCSLVHLSHYQLHVLLWRRVCEQIFQLWILISAQMRRHICHFCLDLQNKFASEFRKFLYVGRMDKMNLRNPNIISGLGIPHCGCWYLVGCDMQKAHYCSRTFSCGLCPMLFEVFTLPP